MIKFFLIVILPVLLAYCHDGIKEIQTHSDYYEGSLTKEAHNFTYYEASHIWFRKVLWLRIKAYWTKMLRL